MFKKIIALILVMCLGVFAVGCSEKAPTESTDDTSSVITESVVEKEPEPEPVKLYNNPLTGEETLTEEQTGKRPIAIMVNNINVAQPVQTGVNKADIVYETEVEGGVTRLLAVYSDVSDIDKIGTIRSARYDFIDLAAGHNAIYFYFGRDEYHAGPHTSIIDDIDLGKMGGGQRIKNGLASEHTYYISGKALLNNIKKKGFKTTTSSKSNWQNFADEGETVSLANTANSVKIPYNYPTTFKYDTASGKYVRYSKNIKRIDYFTKEDTKVKNVFVLNTAITNFDCSGHKSGHKKINLTSGSGYYFVNGTYTQIKWSKGNAKNSMKFTNLDGSPLTVSPGNSWVCIARNSAKITIE